MLEIILDNFKRDSNNKLHDENQYINLIKLILENGKMINGRNGNVLTIIGGIMHFSLKDNIVPILTSKKVAYKTCIKELLWFISGSTDNSKLINNNVKIWNMNASREFLDSRNLNNLEENDLGPIYGHQWRHFNAPYDTCKSDYSNKGVDQLEEIINALKDDKERYSRRLILSSWNPCQINEMALPPCHVLAQFNVIGDELSCCLYQRSCDVGLGVPFNIASYSILTHLLAKHCNLKAKEFIYNLGNIHIYDNHISSLKEQINREIYEFPKINIKNVYDDINKYSLEDIEITNYNSNCKIEMEMR